LAANICCVWEFEKNIYREIYRREHDKQRIHKDSYGKNFTTGTREIEIEVFVKKYICVLTLFLCGSTA